MFTLRTLSVLLAGLSFASVGCVIEAEESSPFAMDDLEVPLESAALDSMNGISAGCFWGHSVQAHYRYLAGGPLANAAGVMPAMPNVPSSCYLAIEDLVKCALPSGVSVTNPHNGAVYSGAAGLASGWRTNPLGSGNLRRWVTACVTQHVNSYGSVHDLLLVGNHPQLADDPSLNAVMPFRSYTLFGDMFSSANPLNGTAPAFTAYACSEGDLDTQCGGGQNEIYARSCDGAGALCGINLIGPCSTACTANGPYWNCTTQGYSQTIRGQWLGPACVP